MRARLARAYLLAAVVLVAVAGSAAVAQAAPHVDGRLEVPGNPDNRPSWSFRSYATETARGPNVPDHRPVLVACRVRGSRVQDGDVWWYRIAAPPWNGRYYVSADDFYNDGRRTGSLKGTPLLDPTVPLC